MIKYFIDMHGCAKNQTDGELVISFLQKEGFCYTENPVEADFILINSCGFIEAAKKESINAVYEIRSAYPSAKIILMGCLAERYSELFFESMPELDGIFGNGDLSKIADFMKKFTQENQNRYVKTYPQRGIVAEKRNTFFNFPASAFVKITEGCSNHCSFCAIPLIRGELRSRPVDDILNEIKDLTNQGIYEINLIGQDIAAYGTGLEDFEIRAWAEKESLSPIAYLFSKISEIPGDFIVRPLYIHPDHFNEGMLIEMKKDSRFLPYFDIPFQSGDDDVIYLMNRTGTAEKYTKLVEKIREYFPQAVIRTTFLTGFPGETDKAAENTEKFLQNITPDWSGCFTYSREEDTAGYFLKPRVPVKIAKKRAEKLEKIQSEITTEKLQKYVNQKLNILVEEIIELNVDVAEDCDEGLAIGRAWFQAPEVDGCVVIRYDRSLPEQSECMKPGNLVEVIIIAVTGVDLDSKFISLKKNFGNENNLKFII